VHGETPWAIDVVARLLEPQMLRMNHATSAIDPYQPHTIHVHSALVAPSSLRRGLCQIPHCTFSASTQHTCCSHDMPPRAGTLASDAAFACNVHASEKDKARRRHEN
jgi:hypothetical protein